MTKPTWAWDMSGRWTDRQHQTGHHETWHGLVAEELGIPIKSISVQRGSDSLGHVKPDGMWPETTDMLTVCVAGYEGAYASLYGADADGAASDFRYAQRLALRLADGDKERAADMITEARGRAAEAIADPDHSFIADKVKRALLERGTLTALEFGEVIARAKQQRAGGPYLSRRRLTDITGDEGPCEARWKRQQAAEDLAEELAQRDATMRKIGVHRVRKPNRRESPTSAKPPKKPKVISMDHRTPEGRALARQMRHELVRNRAREYGHTSAEAEELVRASDQHMSSTRGVWR